MAAGDFEHQVNALTNLGIDGASTDPGQDELTQFLKDGVIDVTNRCIQTKPNNTEDFTKVEESDAQGGLGAGIGQIISVIRESGTSSDWRGCRKTSINLQSRVTDTDSLHFASKFNPVYTVDNKGMVLVYPAPSSGGANSYKVYYVNNVPVNASYASLAYSHSDIGYFPKDKVYLVSIYAAIKSLEAKMADFAIDEEDQELVTAISSNLGSLKQQYEGAFASMAPPQPQQQAGVR